MKHEETREMFSFSIFSAIRGFHVYKVIWENPTPGEELYCRRKVGNSHDPLSVAVIKRIDGEDTIVGHVPRRISALCNSFIRRGGTIQCIVDGSRRYSADLPQGGLEVPCKLLFSISTEEFCKKTETMVCAALSNTTFSLDSSTSKVHIRESDEGHLPVVNKSELYIVSAVEHTHNTTNVDNEVTTNLNQPILVVDNSIPVNTVEEVICSPPKKQRKRFNEESIIMGKQLEDLEIDYAQRLLKSQFPHLNGLQSTLIQQKACLTTDQVYENKIQIVFCNIRKYWIVATTVDCNDGEVKVYDSFYSYLDKESLRTVMNLFTTGNIKPKIKLLPSQKQKGPDDCGVFAICFSVVIAFGLNLGTIRVRQEEMRTHLVNCFNKEQFSPFPVL